MQDTVIRADYDYDYDYVMAPGIFRWSKSPGMMEVTSMINILPVCRLKNDLAADTACS